MKTYKLIVLHAHDAKYVLRYEIEADSFNINAGVYMFYKKYDNNGNSGGLNLICSFPVNLTIIENIESNEK